MTKSFSIGRDKNCDIPIADDSVSRLHAQLTVSEDKILISDCGSSNGTHVVRSSARQRVSEMRLMAGDKVEFGSVTLTFEQLMSALRPEIQPAATPQPKVIRCGCGAVKTANERCPECKQ